MSGILSALANKALIAALLLTAPTLALTSSPAAADLSGKVEVHGVDDGDMLKLREGPGTGYDVIVGLPNGSELRVLSCERIGHARWCRVALARARGLKGYVSEGYLR